MDCEVFDYFPASDQVRGYSGPVQKSTMEHFAKIVTNVNLKSLSILAKDIS